MYLFDVAYRISIEVPAIPKVLPPEISGIKLKLETLGKNRVVEDSL